MGQARELMDRVTAAVRGGDEAALRDIYAADAVVVSPDVGEVRGREAIAEYMASYSRAFPDLYFDELVAYEDGDVAIDEGYFCGTHTGPLPLPDGSELAPTGRKVRIRECDILTAENGFAASHRLYYDQLEFMTQLGLSVEGETAAVPGPRVSSAAAETASAPGSARA